MTGTCLRSSTRRKGRAAAEKISGPFIKSRSTQCFTSFRRELISGPAPRRPDIVGTDRQCRHQASQRAGVGGRSADAASISAGFPHNGYFRVFVVHRSLEKGNRLRFNARPRDPRGRRARPGPGGGQRQAFGAWGASQTRYSSDIHPCGCPGLPEPGVPGASVTATYHQKFASVQTGGCPQDPAGEALTTHCAAGTHCRTDAVMLGAARRLTRPPPVSNWMVAGSLIGTFATRVATHVYGYHWPPCS